MTPGLFNSPQRCRERERLGWRSLQATGALALALALGVRALPLTGTDGTGDGGSSRKESIEALLPPPPPSAPAAAPSFTLSRPGSLPLSSPPLPDVRPAPLHPLPPCPDSSPLPLTALPETEVLPSPSVPLFEADIRLAEAAPASATVHTTTTHTTTVSAPSSATVRAAAAASPLPGKESHARAARYRSTPRPPYPPLLRERHIEGSVRVRILLDASGRPVAVDILTGSGHAAFDDTAQRWILNHWTFYPAEKDGKAVPGRVVTQIHFVMD